MTTPTGKPPRTPAPATGAKQAGSWRSRRAWAVLLGVIIASVGVDLLTKRLAFAHVAPRPVALSRAEVLAHTHETPHGVVLDMEELIHAHEPVHVIPGLLDLRLVLNPGAVFGIGAGKRWIFVGFTGLALGFGLWIFGAKTRPEQHLSHAGIGLLVGGGLGNLYDRLAYACVRDFLHPLPDVLLPFGLRWPMGDGAREVWPWVSNIADLFLLVGIALLMWHIWRSDSPQQEAEGAKPEGQRNAKAP